MVMTLTDSSRETLDNVRDWSHVRNNMSNVVGGNISDAQYEQIMTNMYRQRINDFNSNTQPLINQLEDEAQSTKVYDRAVDRAASLSDRVESVAARMEEYSMDNVLPSQKAAAKTVRQRATSKSKNAIVTKGSIDAKERRRSARNQLLGISEQLQQTGTASMSQALSQKNQRDAAYDAAKGGFMSQVGALAGAGIGFLASGSPAGASLGAAVGGGIGSAIGG